MTSNGFANALEKLNGNEEKLIFGRILESRRISFHELADEIKTIRQDEKTGDLKKLVRERLNLLKSRQWIGELPSSNEDLNIFYLTAEGLMATGEGSACSK